MAVLRLLDVLTNPLEAAILGPARVRELYFRVLTGAQGNAMRAALALQASLAKSVKRCSTSMPLTRSR